MHVMHTHTRAWDMPGLPAAVRLGHDTSLIWPVAGREEAQIIHDGSISSRDGLLWSSMRCPLAPCILSLIAALQMMHLHAVGISVRTLPGRKVFPV